jgi:hypothetical protein
MTYVDQSKPNNKSQLARKRLIESVRRDLALKDKPCKISKCKSFISMDEDPTCIIIPKTDNARINKQELLVQTFLDHPKITSFIFAIVASDSSIVYYRVYRGLGESSGGVDIELD